jgi:hypothetical protein
LLGINDADLPVELPSSTLESPAVTFGNIVRDDQHLRELQELIAKLKDVNQQLALPSSERGSKPVVTVEAPVLDAGPADTASA